MKFVQTDAPEVIESMSAQLIDLLESHGRVLWLVPGGSNVSIVVHVHSLVPKSLQPRLAVLLMDERYGAFDHVNSNLHQLTQAGFHPGASTVVPVLVPGMDFEATIDRYKNVIATALKEATAVYAFFGMGPDGHIAGILPGSPAVKSTKLVTGYETDEYMRITITPAAIKRITSASLVAFGDAKQPALKTLATKKLSYSRQPAQLLKLIPDVTVYNDQIGDRYENSN